MKLVDAKGSTPLGRMATVSAGYPFRGKIDVLPKGKVAVIQMRNADPVTGIDWEGLSHVELPRTSTRACLRPGDIILSTRGDHNFAYCITEQHEPVVCSPHFFIIRINTKRILPQFLTWQINQKPAQGYFASRATGSHILNLKRQVVENLPIRIPSLPEQQRIADLDAAVQAERMVLARLIDNRTAEMAAIAQQLLAPAFQHPEQRAS